MIENILSGLIVGSILIAFVIWVCAIFNGIEDIRIKQYNETKARERSKMLMKKAKREKIKAKKKIKEDEDKDLLDEVSNHNWSSDPLDYID